MLLFAKELKKVQSNQEVTNKLLQQLMNAQPGGKGETAEAILAAVQRRSFLSNNKKRESKAKGGSKPKKPRSDKGKRETSKGVVAAGEKGKVSVLPVHFIIFGE